MFRHRVSGTCPAGDIWTATFHSESTQPLTSVHTAFDTFVASFYNSTMVPLWPTNVALTESVTDQLDATGKHNVAQDVSTHNYVGTAVPPSLPQDLAIVCGLRTALPTRAGRGRFYVPAGTAAILNDDGTLKSTDAGSIASALASDLQAMTATTTPVIFHRLTNTFDAVTAVTIGQVLGVQRRRVNKVPADYVQVAL